MRVFGQRYATGITEVVVSRSSFIGEPRVRPWAVRPGWRLRKSHDYMSRPYRDCLSPHQRHE